MENKYRKIPIEVNAVQWKGSNRTEIELFMDCRLECSVLPTPMEYELDDIPKEAYTLKIPTREGTQIAVRGDWIIEGETEDHGKHYWVNKPDYFKKAYEAAPASPPSPAIDGKEEDGDKWQRLSDTLLKRSDWAHAIAAEKGQYYSGLSDGLAQAVKQMESLLEDKIEPPTPPAGAEENKHIPSDGPASAILQHRLKELYRGFNIALLGDQEAIVRSFILSLVEDLRELDAKHHHFLTGAEAVISIETPADFADWIQQGYENGGIFRKGDHYLHCEHEDEGYVPANRLFEFYVLEQHGPSALSKIAAGAEGDGEIPFDVCTDIYIMWVEDKGGFFFPPYQAGAIAMWQKMQEGFPPTKNPEASYWFEKSRQLLEERNDFKAQLSAAQARIATLETEHGDNYLIDRLHEANLRIVALEVAAKDYWALKRTCLDQLEIMEGLRSQVFERNDRVVELEAKIKDLQDWHDSHQ